MNQFNFTIILCNVNVIYASVNITCNKNYMHED